MKRMISEKEKKPELVDVVIIVSKVLKLAILHGLEGEVIATAMIHLKENPNASIEEALDAGLRNWKI